MQLRVHLAKFFGVDVDKLITFAFTSNVQQNGSGDVANQELSSLHFGNNQGKCLAICRLGHLLKGSLATGIHKKAVNGNLLWDQLVHLDVDSRGLLVVGRKEPSLAVAVPFLRDLCIFFTRRIAYQYNPLDIGLLIRVPEANFNGLVTVSARGAGSL